MIQTPIFNDTIGIMTVVTLIPAFYLWLEKRVKWKIFNYFPAIIWIFITPIIFSNLGIIPKSSPVYGTFKAFAVPMFIILMLLDINIRESFKVAWRSVGVLIVGCVGIVVGASVAFYLFRWGLAPGSWSGFGALAGSWIGGTGNLAAVAESLNTPPDQVGIVVLVDNLVYIVYFPIILLSVRWAKIFNRFTRVSKKEIEHFNKDAAEIEQKSHEIHFTDVITLMAVGFACILVARWLSALLPEIPPVFSTKTWAMLIITTLGIILSATKLKKVPGTKPLSLMFVYIYMTMMGAMADLNNIGGAYWFLVAGFLCIAIHFLFVTIASRLFRVDVSMAAIASVAAVGGAASAPVAAGYHREELVPISIMLALIGYALGNYLGIATAYLCHLFV